MVVAKICCPCAIFNSHSVFSKKKMKFSILTGSFSFDGINEFLRDLSYGKGRTNPVRGELIFVPVFKRPL